MSDNSCPNTLRLVEVLRSDRLKGTNLNASKPEIREKLLKKRTELENVVIIIATRGLLIIITLREKRSIVVDVLEVDLHVGVSDEAVTALVLGEHCEPPLGPSIRLVPIQRLRKDMS
jgi:hypothetical protein